MRTPFINSRAMALTLALESVGDEVKRSSHRTRRRVRRTHEVDPDERRG
jgi:hypothetical protein